MRFYREVSELDDPGIRRVFGENGRLRFREAVRTCLDTYYFFDYTDDGGSERPALLTAAEILRRFG